MFEFKKYIAKEISKIVEIEEGEVLKYIENPKDTKNGDYSFPCFNLAKILKKSPQMIVSDIKEKIEFDENIIEKVDVMGGYLNIYINKELLAKEVLNEINNKDEYGKSDIGKGKNVIVEYSSPNIAKPFHIGHLRTTLIGNCLYKIYKYLGYNVTGINHLGDYGTQFGKMIEGYKLWGSEYDLTEDSINKMMDIYVRINELCKKDENVLNQCRENFRLLENGDKECVDLWNRFKDLSMVEFDRIYDILGVKFDSLNGEAFYADKMDDVIETLEKSGKVEISEGAKIINLEDEGISTPCIIQKANGSTIYATRDLAAVMYRTKTYDFDKCLYVVGSEQNLHFKQIFAVAKNLVDEKYIKGLKHISYGMISLPTGKMSTRLGNVVTIEKLLNETVGKAKEIIEEKNPSLEDKEEAAKKVGIGSIIFNTLSASNIKDQIFDWETALNFQGETGPYIQYTYVRTKSVLEKANRIPKIEDIDVKYLTDIYSYEVLKLIYGFKDILISATNKHEQSLIARYLIDLSKAFSIFYNENKIICENMDERNARVYLTYAVGKVLEIGANLLGMEMPEKM